MKRKIILAIKALMAAFTRKILGIHVYGLIVKSDHGLFTVDPEDYGVGRQLRMRGKYGEDELARLKVYLEPESRVLIVGAHVGSLAIPIAKLCNEVIAIEANPATYNFLQINIGLNSVSNCRAINIGASEKAENIEFLLSRANSGGSKRVPKNREYIYYYDNPETIKIKAASLDDYFEERDFDLIIMDIEGSEYFALKGMQEILSHAKVLVVEFIPHHLKNVAGVTVEEFLSVIKPHFSKLTIPSRQESYSADEFLGCLSKMYERGEEDEGIIFKNVLC